MMGHFSYGTNKNDNIPSQSRKSFEENTIYLKDYIGFLIRYWWLHIGYRIWRNLEFLCQSEKFIYLFIYEFDYS